MYYYQKNGRFVYLCINAGHEFGTSVRMLWINELEQNLLVLIVQSLPMPGMLHFGANRAVQLGKPPVLAVVGALGM